MICNVPHYKQILKSLDKMLLGNLFSFETFWHIKIQKKVCIKYIIMMQLYLMATDGVILRERNVMNQYACSSQAKRQSLLRLIIIKHKNHVFIKGKHTSVFEKPR